MVCHITSSPIVPALVLLCATTLTTVITAEVISVRGKWEGMAPLVWHIESRTGVWLLTYEANPNTSFVRAHLYMRDGKYHGQGSYDVTGYGTYNASTGSAVLVDAYSAKTKNNAIDRFDKRRADIVRRQMWRILGANTSRLCRFILRFDAKTLQHGDVHTIEGTFKSRNCYASLRFNASSVNVYEHERKSKRYAIFVTALCIIQSLAILIQKRGKWTLERANTMSLFTLIMMLLIPLYASAMHLALAMKLRNYSLWYLIASALAFLCVVCYISWVLSIWDARCDDRPRPTVIAEKASFLLVLCAAFGLFLYTGPLWTHYSTAVVIAQFSFFLPQIATNTNIALHPIFVAISTLTYVAVPLYLWTCPVNYFEFLPRPVAAITLTIWVVAQAITLAVQYARHMTSARYVTIESYG